MTATESAPLAETLRQVCARIAKELPRADSEAATALAGRFLGFAEAEDLEGETPENLFGLAAAVWDHFRRRARGVPKVRAYNPNIEEHGWHCRHSVVEVVNDDSPFLLDSTLAALNLLDLTVHLVIHPVLPVRRRDDGRALQVGDSEGAEPESVIHVQVTRQTDTADLEAIVGRLEEVYADIRAAVEDWRPMLARVDELVEELRRGKLPVAETEVAEGVAFLEWLRDDNFTFLGVRDYRIEVRGDETFLRAEEGQGLGVLRTVSEESRRRYADPVPGHYASYLRRRELFVISKAWSRSKVHRAVYMDYIGVRRFDAEGNVIGERRFLGLLTSTAYSTRPTRIPLLRHKVESVLTESGLTRGGHDAKALRNVLENYPRDELFQVDLPFLGRTAREIVRLEHRQRLRLFLRRDGYGNFFSALVFVPRDAYSTGLREQMEAILRHRLNGDSVETATQFSEAPMVRAHFIVRIDDSSGAEPDTLAIERELANAARNWNDDFLEVLVEAHGEAEGARRHRQFARALPARYKADFAPRAAVADTDRIVPLQAAGQLALNLYRPVGADENELNFKVYRRGRPIPLSSILPMLEHMGFVVLEERSYAVSAERPEDGVTIHDFRISSRFGTELEVAALRDRFEALFSDIWRGRAASDNFNCLVVHGLDGREVSLMRAYAKYLRQVKAPFSLAYMAETLADHPEITRLLVAQIRALHDPAGDGDPNRRAAALHRQIQQELEGVASADQDRILRRFLNLINATLRTNFFQRDAERRPKSAIALKFECNAITALPEPRPWREVFVHSPNFEAVHLRGGRVARGGIRWSDRREDYRTEILGLMKAQSVKNAVIVPVGAKGGFALTRPPAEPDALRREAVRCYRTFMASLLDVTDDLVAGEVVRRAGSVHHDGDDPYLVVAADKGTATFSDEANAVSESYGYWLGDAFASGGSAGYDHKVMGITARGAWEAVKRHFRELGLDTRSEPFTVVGIGDMSGDVFGNGMLLSEHIRLAGAFNHLHIFVDPDPDPAAGFAERQRLFALPRSSWEDYDRSLLSEGGAIFSRQAKQLTLSPQIRERFGIRAEKIEPNALIRALLTAEVDLLWNGGIGTYVKAHDETHAEVDDRTNDPLRVNAGDVRARVIGEGGNLGLTQAARVEFARKGGKVNSDAIDNSAGVDCSDHEVNIKILLNGAVASGDLTGKQRDQRLAAMTGEVAAMVLRHNYLQTQCLSMVESFGVRMFEEQARFLRRLEGTGRLAEEMPDEEELDRRRAAGEPFTRPELGVLMAYAKTGLFDELVQSNLPDDPYLERELFDYFPEPLRPEFSVRMPEHRLRREIIATRVANSTIERAGLTYIHRHTEHSGILAPAVARAYLQVREIFDLERLWTDIEKTDYQIPAALQAQLHARLMFFTDRMTSWFLRYVPPLSAFSDVVPGYREGVQAIDAALDAVLDAGSRSLRDEDRAALAAAGTPDHLADALARIEPLGAACDIVEVARQTGATPVEVAAVFFEVGHRYGCGWLRQRARQLPQSEHWSMLAAQTIAEDSYAHQRTLTARILNRAGDSVRGTAAIDAWAKDNEEALRRFSGVFQELQSAMSLDLAMLSLANRALRVLAETAELHPGE